MDTIKLKKIGRLDNKIKFKSGRQEAVELQYTGTNLTKADIIAQVKQSQKDFLGKPKFKNGDWNVTISIRYDGVPRPWRNGYSFKLKDNDPLLFDPSLNDSDLNAEEIRLLKETNSFSRFDVRITRLRPINQVGCDGKTTNDCMYNALKKSKVKLPLVINSQAKLKQYFGLERDALFPLVKCTELAKLLKTQIRLKGSTKVYGNFTRAITLKVKNNHVYLEEPNNFTDITVARLPKQLLVCGQGLHSTYDGVVNRENQREIVKGYQRIAKSPEAQYVIVRVSDSLLKFLSLESNATLAEIYNKFTDISNELKIKSDGFVDMHCCGSNLTDYALYLLNKTLPYTYGVDNKVDEFEASFLKNSGGFLYGKPYTGMCYEYDKNKAYQALLLEKSFRIPVSKPTYEIFNKDSYISKLNGSSYYPFGSYKCTVEKSNDTYINSLFRFQKDNVYTHFDLQRAEELNLTITHVDNGEANCALYKTERVQSDEIFETFINKIFALEDIVSEQCKGIVKHLRNVVWGALCKYNREHFYADEKGITHVDDDEYEVSDIYRDSQNEENYVVAGVLKSQPFMYSMARLGPYLTSRLRNEMSKQVQSLGDVVVRSATDSIFSTVPLDLPISTEAGDYKLKKKFEIVIKNCQDFEWQEKKLA